VPAVAVSSPANNATFDVGVPINLEVNFADANRQWTKVEYFNGSTLIASVDASPFSYTWEEATAGTYNIKVKATDSEGHITESEAVKIVVGDGGATATADLLDCLPGLAHYFEIDETEGNSYTDVATSATATCDNCPAPVANGLFEGAQHFNGTRTGLDFATVESFNWAADGSFSMGIWKRTSEAIAGNMVILGRDAADSDAGVHWWIGLNTQGQAMFSLKDAAHAGIEIGGSGPQLNDGDWHYIVAQRDAAANMNRLFVDGALLQEAQAQYANDFADGASVNIGYINRSGGFHYAGDLDEVKVYDRALTGAEIEERYNGGNGTHCGQNPLGITENKTFAGTFEVFPNPTIGQQVNIFITNLLPREEANLMLVDMTGKTVLEHKATAGSDGTILTTINPEKGISIGLYNLLLYTAERKLSRKVIIAR
jgi:hypothetical protein